MDAKFTTRPVVRGTNWAVASGNYIGTIAGFHILSRGGNAIDGAAAMGFALAVVEPHNYTIGGEVPILIHLGGDKKVLAVSGQGFAPKAMSIEWFKSRGIELIPGDGLLPATVPAAVSAWITVLKEYGKLSLREVLEPAITLAEEGFPVYWGLSDSISSHAEIFMRHYPTTAEVFLPNGKVPQESEVLKQKELGRTLRILAEAERKASHRGREAGLDAAHEAFYEGEISEKIHDFAQRTMVTDATGERHNGFLTKDDLGSYSTSIEEPVSIDYKGYMVYKCGPWTQGPVFLQILRILEGFDLRRMGHNSIDYLHVLIEAFKLAFADREKYYGDPRFDYVPLDILLSSSYAEARRSMIDMNCAISELTPGEVKVEPRVSPDTTHIDAVDKEGNMVSATPSGAWIMSSPLIKGLGFPLGTRGQMFYLDKNRANALRPGKRPRTTLTPSLVTKDEKPFLVFGTPGGDQQDQWTLQFFLNFIEFEMNMQEALDAPLIHTLHFPSSFYPREAYPKRVVAEDRIPSHVIEGLRARGHDCICMSLEGFGPSWSQGRTTAACISADGKVLSAAASPRKMMPYALAW